MKLIVGLGNPGTKYDQTKHNIGFMTIDAFCQKHELNLRQEKFEGLFLKTKINDHDVIILKPLTFMNDSGRSVAPFANFYKINPRDIMVIQDDMDLPLAKLRIRSHGASGGHNGIKSIISSLGSQDFNRLKIGIQHPQKHTVVNWVLTPFVDADKALIDQSIKQATNALDDFVNGRAVDYLMNRYN